MILVDTSVWVDHLREPIEEVERLAAAVLLVQHPFVTGELALGTWKKTSAILAFLSEDLPKARIASETEFLAFVANERISGTGIGFVDAHLLASCRLMPGTLLWSRDKRLQRWAEDTGLAWSSR